MALDSRSRLLLSSDRSRRLSYYLLLSMATIPTDCTPSHSPSKVPMLSYLLATSSSSYSTHYTRSKKPRRDNSPNLVIPKPARNPLCRHSGSQSTSYEEGRTRPPYSHANDTLVFNATLFFPLRLSSSLSCLGLACPTASP